MGRVLKYLLFLVFFVFARALLRSVFQGFQSVREPKKDAALEVPVGGELKKDPVCGTYVSTTGITQRVDGQVFYFCSEECRAKYTLAASRH